MAGRGELIRVRSILRRIRTLKQYPLEVIARELRISTSSVTRRERFNSDLTPFLREWVKALDLTVEEGNWIIDQYEIEKGADALMQQYEDLSARDAKWLATIAYYSKELDMVDKVGKVAMEVTRLRPPLIEACVSNMRRRVLDGR